MKLDLKVTVTYGKIGKKVKVRKWPSRLNCYHCRLIKVTLAVTLRLRQTQRA